MTKAELIETLKTIPFDAKVMFITDGYEPYEVGGVVVEPLTGTEQVIYLTERSYDVQNRTIRRAT